MSDCYYLICMDCKEGIHLGKPISIKYAGVASSSYGFEEFGSGGGDFDDRDYWSTNERFCGLLQQFLMLHRLHELRVLPDTVEKYESADGKGICSEFPLDDPDEDISYDEFFKRETGEPNPQKEADELPVEFIERLKKFT